MAQRYTTKNGHLVEFFKQEGSRVCVKLVSKKPLSGKEFYWYEIATLKPVVESPKVEAVPEVVTVGKEGQETLF